MEEPPGILAFLDAYFGHTQDLLGKQVLITAGPTYEAIDPVRFIGNRSSGKMGIALAEEAVKRGAKVVLILGPTALKPTQEAIDTVRVESAQEMYEQAMIFFPQSDIAILAAAVADYRPMNVAQQKIKKKTNELELKLERTTDIAAALGQLKRDTQSIVGFALETNDGEKNARRKLEQKNFDLIVLNSLEDAGAGFQHDTNKISILSKGNKTRYFELKTKTAVAKDIVDTLLDIRYTVHD